MSLAEQLYNESQENPNAPPLWLDITFIIIISIIHFVYAFKFTKFSLAYLKAKCEEKKTKTKWTESKLYLHATLSYKVAAVSVNSTDDPHQQHVPILKLWSQLSIIRNTLKLLMILCCIVALVLYITFILNITFEFFIACFVTYKVVSFLTLLILPFWFFINYQLIQYVIYGTIATWKVNVDTIADEISYQQKQKTLKKYTFKDMTNDANDIEDHPQSSWKAFLSPIFMAFHWRLLIVICCVVSTIIALPTIARSLEEKGTTISDCYFRKVFLRYVLIAMMLWLFIYFWFLAVLPACYGRIATISIFNEVVMNDGDVYYNIERLCCFMDAFGLKETNQCWKKYKITYCILLIVTGILLIILGSITNMRLLLFIGIVNLLYFAMTILANNKPTGIHYLWQSDMKSLELNWFQDMEPDHSQETGNMNRADSVSSDEIGATHLSTMTALKHHKMQRLLTNNLTVDNFDSDTHVLSIAEQTNLIDEQKELFSPISDDLSQVRDALYGSDEDDDEHVLQSEEEVMTLFTSLYINIYNDRRHLFEERATMNCLNRFCVDFKIMLNYFYSIFKLYKVYWLVILPYNYEMTPLSGICGKSIEERVINFNYNKYSCLQTIFAAIKCCWHSVKSFLFCCTFFAIIWIAIYLSVTYSGDIDNVYNEINPYGGIENGTIIIDANHTINVPLYYHTRDAYPICSLNWNGNLSIFDVASLARMAYDIEIDPAQQLMSIQDLMCMYFDGIVPNKSHSVNASAANCTWNVVYISRLRPVFMHLRHEKNNTDVISIKGTENVQDLLQDISLFNQVALLQTASWIIPITAIFPQSFLIQLIYRISLFEQVIDRDIRAGYDGPVLQYAYNYLLSTSNAVEAFYFMGHSFGGGVSQAVAAQLYRLSVANDIINGNDEVVKPEIKSFAMSAPGLILNSRKFSLNVRDLFETATLLKPRYDIVSSIDIVSGLVQNIECHRGTFYACHDAVAQICELMNHCNAYKGNNPDLIAAVCMYMDDMGMSYMHYSNYSALVKENYQDWDPMQRRESQEIYDIHFPLTGSG